MSSDSTRMCELLVGLPDVNVLEVVETDVGWRVTIETRGDRPLCVGCGGAVKVKDRRDVEHADLPCFGRPTVLVWRKIRWECSIGCGAKSSTETAAAIAAPRQRLTDRAGRWATMQVGRRGRPVSDVASELGAGWDPVMDAVVGYGQVLIDDPGRFGDVEAIGLDETLRCKTGRWKAQQWSTQIVDVGAGQLLDVVEGRNSTGPCEWFAEQPQHWLDAIRWAALDLSGPYRLVFNTMIPAAVQVADPFHVHKLANTHLDECRRRVQNETMGHRGRKDDPLYRCRRLLTKADERLDERGQAKLLGLLQAGDPRGEVKAMWHAKQVLAETGMRVGQALGLRHSDFVSRRREVTIVPRADNANGARTKTQSAVTLPVSAPLVRLYSDYMHSEYGPLDSDYVFVNLWSSPIGRPLRYDSVAKLVGRLRTRTGIEFTPHTLRHSRATELIRSGVAIEIVSKMLTHRSVTTTSDTYVHLDVDDLRAELVRVGAWDSEPC